jgi:two-component system cell cycle sensor histidine kinase/response regulator CckA
VSTWTDITEQRSLEEQFRQSQKMEAVGRLAGGVAHDFNNLLTVIMAESELALSGGTTQETLASLDQIKKAAERAAMLTRQLLTFSRRQLIEPVTLCLNDVVVEVEKLVARLVGENVQLTVRKGLDLGFATADSGHMEQVLVNLVVNARDAMPEGGSLIIETENVRLGQEYADLHPWVVPGDFVMLAVSDTGEGMTDDVKQHIFEPFFTTKPLGKGTGLGLATCYAIVRQFEGHIAVYSEVGVGTTMRVYLPRVVPPGGEAEQRPVSVIPAGTETILLVEDEANVRRVTARMLVARGYSVLEAGNAEEALEMIRFDAGHVDLLLTDVILPKMGGRELAERVRTARPKIRVLFTSGYSDDVILQNRLLEHGISLLQKPFTSEALAHKVREALDSAES